MPKNKTVFAYLHVVAVLNQMRLGVSGLDQNGVRRMPSLGFFDALYEPSLPGSEGC